MSAHWYLAHDDELLVDIDAYDRPTKTGELWGEVFFRRRLRSAIASHKLHVRDVWLDESNTPGHFHGVVRLTEPMDRVQRLVWQMHLGSDLYRGRADLMRAARGIAAPSLLIRSRQFRTFYRPADRVCSCTQKHVTDELARGERVCDVWTELRGMSPWELFGESNRDAEKTVSLPVGMVPIEKIMRRVAR